MKALTIKGTTYEPKLNYAFYRQTRDDEELKSNNQDGFSSLVAGLIDENVDMVVKAYYHSLAYLRRSQPAESTIEENLESLIFNSDDETNKSFDDIINSLKTNGFLTRKLSEYVKNNEKNADIVQDQLEKMKDEEKRQQMQVGLEQIQEETNKLKKLLTPTDSSPKQDGLDSPLPN